MIELVELNKTFMLGEQSVHALDQINLRIDAGEYLSVMGPSGSGKSTLLNMLGLLDRPDSGRYLLNGLETTALDETERARKRSEMIGFVFQAYHLVARLSARENIELPLMLSGVPGAERRRRSKQVMERLGIADRGHHLPRQLSGGQRQRVALARAIIRHPLLLLADEPTGNLDSQSGAEVVTLIEELNRDGITLLVVTHDLALGQRAARQLKMVDGRIVEDRCRQPAVPESAHG
ncbi:MAG: ABC transporter ATP-binding protein [Gammaproteobacteria bacterium]|uniref:ABC transporter ATP-binding protein n=1 Tax=Pseudomaricurvus alcaniphilus TaxID=1166482 RepID=UPI00140D991D|nr:ABC transporter ATP-binding protein [Pseudomaricurvus alcaniphilus]MBR9909602.1 ABC transporter ATP-binding protein [Gammaproteobacteria bacterium]NHN36982.1 ABC transporter ATP-binding protein [Pseudomaricurvus alcaniphilus]